MRIKEAAKVTGLSEATIRFYESRGLVVPDLEERNGRLWRDYTPEQVRLLTAVATLRRACFRLEEIAELLQAPEKIPTTLLSVRERVEETYAAMGALRLKLSQAEITESPDVLTLAERLNAAAAPLALPETDVKYDYRAYDRPASEARPLRRIFGGKLLAAALCLWVLTMAALTVVLAGDYQRQVSDFFAAALEGTLAKFRAEEARMESLEPQDILLPLPELHFTPAYTLPLLRPAKSACWTGSMTLDETATIAASAGFDLGELPPGSAGLGVIEGRLSLRPYVSIEPRNTTRDLSEILGTHTFRLTFRIAPARHGSFPSAEIKDSYPIYDGARAAAPGDHTAQSLLDGIESGTYHFDSHRILHATVLRGAWLRDSAGEPYAFALAAYGFMPLFTAMNSLAFVYLLSLLLFLLAGWLLNRALRPLVTKPMERLAAALNAEPLEISEREFDFPSRVSELRNVEAGYLLRRQMQAALPLAPENPTEKAPLCAAFQRAADRLLPILLDRGQKLQWELTADGLIPTTPEALEQALLALLREAVSYADSGRDMTLRTRELSDFLLAEAEIRTRYRQCEEQFYLLYSGIYIAPADGDAPGAKLRRTSAAIPGSFCAVRKTKTGLVLTLGLPCV